MQTVERTLAKKGITHPCDIAKFLFDYFNDDEEDWSVIRAVIRKLLEVTNVLYGQSFWLAVHYTLRYLSQDYVLECFCSHPELRNEIIEKVRFWRRHGEITRFSENTQRMDLIEQYII